MKPLVIYHANCADGFGAAFAAWLILGDDAEYWPVKHEKNYNELEALALNTSDREVYILDFSFQREDMEGVFRRAKHVVWLDHHKTAFEMWCPGELTMWMSDPLDTSRHIKLDNNKSGALIAWEYFHPNTEIPMLIQHIDDYDRWQFKLSGTRSFIKSLWSWPFDFRAWQLIFFSEGYTENAYKFAYKEGDAILRAHEQNVQAVVANCARECSINMPMPPGGWGVSDVMSYYGFSANCPAHLTSDVGHVLASQSGTFGLLWYMGTNEKIKCSLRSNGAFDVSSIAKVFGGGGHKNAAGFEIDIDTLKSWIETDNIDHNDKNCV